MVRSLKLNTEILTERICQNVDMGQHISVRQEPEPRPTAVQRLNHRLLFLFHILVLKNRVEPRSRGPVCALVKYIEHNEGVCF